ncbi:MAG TPA: response regulator [Planctomycetota bacterium]|nr:response regulator [Planctomycetota bacterium]
MQASVLIIDDNPTESALFDEAKSECGAQFASTASTDAGSAIVALRGSSATAWPDIVLLDINMPRFNGWDFLLLRLRDERLRQLPIFMHSSSAHEPHILRAFGLGADGYLVKPTSWDDSLALVAALDRYLTHGEPMRQELHATHVSLAPWLERQHAAWKRWIMHRTLIGNSRLAIARSLDALGQRGAET